MKLQSKIRHIFSDELLSLLASVCDTKRIDSSQEKMKILADLLYTYDVKFRILGGATNRLVLFIEGYAIKFALDSQGYRDNLVEYSICEELQPYVTKAYETNGYVLVAECVRILSETDFIARKQDMLSILVSLADDYLLGDVGYIKKNLTNWGIRDNGELVILDYAYCHRATEMLFTCPVCGEGVLVYDHVFEKLMCTNKSVCRNSFTYDDKKSEQGDQVDLDMIEERKATSLVLTQGITYAEVTDPTTTGRFTTRDGKKVIVVDNDLAYYEMMEAKENMIAATFDARESLDALIRMAASGDTSELSKDTVVLTTERVSTPNADYEIDPDYMSERLGRLEDQRQQSASENADSEEEDFSIDNLLRELRMKRLDDSEEDADSLEQDVKLGICLDGMEL